MTPERSLYSDEVMDHFLHPRNSGDLADSTFSVEQINAVCGDRIVFHIKLDGNTIVDVRFRSFGCAVAVAAASLVTEAIKGRTTAEAKRSAAEALTAVRKGTAEDKVHCSKMVEEVLNKTLLEIDRRSNRATSGDEELR